MRLPAGPTIPTHVAQAVCSLAYSLTNLLDSVRDDGCVVSIDVS